MDNITINDIILLLKNNRLNWRQVAGLICVNAEFKSYNFKLCSYAHYGTPAVSVTINNIKTGESNIFDNFYLKGTAEYPILLQIYNHATSTSQKIMTVGSN